MDGRKERAGETREEEDPLSADDASRSLRPAADASLLIGTVNRSNLSDARTRRNRMFRHPPLPGRPSVRD